ncbi:MAG: NAD-dependent isocitrate dehydrogenase [Holophagales bacterium]|nr:NAD-dependent isocitrate dehydrogenase [Holophagales bacterium]
MTTSDKTAAPPRVALIVGSIGIGAETAPPVLEILESTGADFDFVRVDVPTAVRRNTEPVLGEAADTIRDCRVALKTRLIGPGSDAVRVGPGPQNPNVALRQMLGLWASVRPVRSIPGLPTRYPDLDVLLIREITESVYRGIEHEIVDGVVESMKVVSRAACRRIADYAFRIAQRHGRGKVTAIHKANIMKQSDGLFLDTVRDVAAGYPDIEVDDCIVDAACMRLVLNPYDFDVMLMENLYGDILSNLGAGLAGGISTGHAINVGDDCHVFEAVHGDAPHLIGTGQANLLPLLTPAIALLRHFDLYEEASRIDQAVTAVLEEGRNLTPDLGGQSSTWQMARAIIAAMN